MLSALVWLFGITVFGGVAVIAVVLFAAAYMISLDSRRPR